MPQPREVDCWREVVRWRRLDWARVVDGHATCASNGRANAAGSDPGWCTDARASTSEKRLFGDTCAAGMGWGVAHGTACLPALRVHCRAGRDEGATLLTAGRRFEHAVGVAVLSAADWHVREQRLHGFLALEKAQAPKGKAKRAAGGAKKAAGCETGFSMARAVLGDANK